MDANLKNIEFLPDDFEFVGDKQDISIDVVAPAKPAWKEAIGIFSQNKGADQGKRIRQALRYAYIYDVVLAAIVTIGLLLFATNLVQLISGSKEPVVINNGSLYLKIVGPFYMILGILMQTRYALQGIGQKMLPLISSVIEFVGKIIFVIAFIPQFGYMAVIFCEPVIWCVMAIQLVYSFYSNSYIKKFK